VCGISGFFTQRNYDIDSAISYLVDMNDQLYKRGPDDKGYWYDEVNKIGLAHRRLSIIEISKAGHQPMISFSGRYIIIFNGEIYNHLNLRKDIINYPWKGSSDTETLLASIELWGVPETLEKIEGMFAFALWDKDEKKLILARDRIGEKPLYYGWQGKTFLFASELKAFLKHPEFNKEIDREALELYVRNGYVPSTKSIFNGINKLQPGCYLSISINDPINDIIKINKYWDFLNVVKAGHDNPFKGNTNEALFVLENLLIKSVSQQMLSDVPLGAFLSGGTDSSLIVSLMQSISNQPIKTFTIGFEEKIYNEAHYAKNIANHLKTDHTELYVSSKEAMEMIPEMSLIYDEPFADASQIPTFLVSKLAKKSVSVTLSGDAGDELFGGYDRYDNTIKTWNKLNRVPYSARNIISKFFPNKSYVEGLLSHNIDEFYNYMNSQWKGINDLVVNTKNHQIESNLVFSEFEIPKERLMINDTLKYLPDDILVKVDRAAMANSLETRVPLLNHKIVEFAWSLPLNVRCRDNITKWPLKQILYKYIPEGLLNRPKMGFGIPIGIWLRGPLKEWAENLLSIERLSEDGFFNVSEVRKAWNQHLSGKYDRHYWLWTILMFQTWYDNIRK
jgi:asparagine synthase (glutamine-hydrolysing)